MDEIWKNSSLNPENYFQSFLDTAEYKAESFGDILSAIEYAFLLEECKGNSQARSYAASLETRIKTISNRFSSLLVSDPSKATDLSMNPLLTVFDVQNLEDDLLLFFSSFLLKKVFTFESGKNLSDRQLNLFIFEEAHRYISKSREQIKPHEVEIFKKIAREGRKFGCFMHLSSQRPSELSSTVLSQCNNFLIHRIKNNHDLEHMSSTIPYLSKHQINRISYLPVGTVLMVGSVFPIPIEISTFMSDSFVDTKTPALVWD